MVGNSVDSSHFRQAWQYYSRIYIGQIDAINTSTGTCTVIFLDNLAIKRETLEISVGAFSMQGFQSSWFRFMPQLNDLVYVGFGPRGEARILGPATAIGMQQAFFNQKKTDPSSIPVGDLTELAQGEYDLRSSGGAYIYGDQYGTLLLSAGAQTQLRLNKKQREARGEAGLWVLGTQGSYVRVGDVKRLLPGGYQETNLIQPVVRTGDTATKEWNVHIEIPVVGGVSLLVVDEQFGSVVNNLGVITPSTLPGVILRSRKKIWQSGQPTSTPVPVAAWSEEIDILGNKQVECGPTATVDITTAPTVSRETTLLNETVTASGTVNLTGTTAVDITSAGPVTVTSATPYGVKLGNAAATEPLVLGDTFMVQQNLISEQLLLLVSALNIVLPAIQATSPTLSLPGTPTQIAFEAASTAIGALTGLLTGYVAQTATPATNPMLSKISVTV